MGKVSFFVHEGQSSVESINAYEIAFDLGFYGRHEFFLFATGSCIFYRHLFNGHRICKLSRKSTLGCNGMYHVNEFHFNIFLKFL